mmetsp:Transcript_68302/g.148694  ORF Transcript_68302/g.148694 Transcript_68302/m.148694 type:complete len:83 (+) Transcript_68302:145-393(+)
MSPEAAAGQQQVAPPETAAVQKRAAPPEFPSLQDQNQTVLWGSFGQLMPEEAARLFRPERLCSGPETAPGPAPAAESHAKCR